jgi:hypothetical protein
MAAGAVASMCLQEVTGYKSSQNPVDRTQIAAE